MGKYDPNAFNLGKAQQDLMRALYTRVIPGVTGNEESPDVQRIGERAHQMEEDALSGLVGAGLGDQPQLLAAMRTRIRLGAMRQANEANSVYRQQQIANAFQLGAPIIGNQGQRRPKWWQTLLPSVIQGAGAAFGGGG